MPALNALLERFGGKGLALVGIGAFDSREAVEKKVEDKGLKYLVAYDGNEPESATAYNVKGIPSNWLIDKEGTIRLRGHSLAELERKIAELLEEGGGKPAPSSGGKSGE